MILAASRHGFIFDIILHKKGFSVPKRLKCPDILIKQLINQDQLAYLYDPVNLLIDQLAFQN